MGCPADIQASASKCSKFPLLSCSVQKPELRIPLSFLAQNNSASMRKSVKNKQATLIVTRLVDDFLMITLDQVSILCISTKTSNF